MKHQLKSVMIERARDLRRKMTDAERKIWWLLRENFKAWHLRRQVPIGPDFADFASHSARIVIEVDGSQHNASVDNNRTALIEGEGYRILRFWNYDALSNPEGVFTAIHKALLALHRTPNPSPSRGGE